MPHCLIYCCKLSTTAMWTFSCVCPQTLKYFIKLKGITGDFFPVENNLSVILISFFNYIREVSNGSLIKQMNHLFFFRYEFGQALFIGWAAASLCLLGGALLCCSCPRKTTSYPTPRPYPKPAPSSGKDYVWHRSESGQSCWNQQEMDIEILALTLRS